MTKRSRMPAKDQLILAIARDHLFFETLETRRSDSLDFREVSVWGVKAALEAAYAAGIAAGKAQARPEAE
jgi:hypothetical protein